jgi:hydrogenase nickel incorporation protein HypA/HybF
VDDSVQFYWDMISENTLAEGAQLVFRRVPVELLCLSCAQRYSPNGNELACPSCGAAQVKIIAGEEFYVEAIDVQMEDSKEAK